MYDVHELKSQAPCGSERLIESAAQDATSAFEATHHSEEARDMMARYFVGNYVDVSNLFLFLFFRNFFLIDF